MSVSHVYEAWKTTKYSTSVIPVCLLSTCTLSTRMVCLIPKDPYPRVYPRLIAAANSEVAKAAAGTSGKKWGE